MTKTHLNMYKWRIVAQHNVCPLCPNKSASDMRVFWGGARVDIPLHRALTLATAGDSYQRSLLTCVLVLVVAADHRLPPLLLAFPPLALLARLGLAGAAAVGRRARHTARTGSAVGRVPPAGGTPGPARYNWVRTQHRADRSGPVARRRGGGDGIRTHGTPGGGRAAPPGQEVNRIRPAGHNRSERRSLCTATQRRPPRLSEGNQIAAAIPTTRDVT